MKILLISHNCFSTYQNMGKTFLSLFSACDKNEICQLYIYPTIPDVDACSSYYRVTDRDVLNSIIKFKRPGGEIDKSRIAVADKNLFESEQDAQLYKKQGSREPSKRLLRDLMWKLARWHTRDLEAWLDRESPSAIFLSPGYAKFIYDIALKISKKRGIPIVTYICDDYYFVNTPRSLMGRLQLSLLRQKTDAIMKKTSYLVTICNEIREIYSEKFKVESGVVMTGASRGVAESVSITDKPRAISYFGNISCNRYVSLAEIGRTLDRLNADRGSDYMLKIYTSEKNPEILAVFDRIESVKLCGFISGDAFYDAVNSADILLHTEAFDEASIDLVKHSVSTKIADSLSSGVPLFAYGPDNVASMRHLIENNAAIVSTSEKTLDEALICAFENAQARRTAAENGLLLAKRCHDSAVNGQKIKDIFANL